MTVVGTPSPGAYLPPTTTDRPLEVSGRYTKTWRARSNVTVWVLRIPLLVATFALVFELTCRIEDWVRYRTPILSPFTSQTDLIILGPDGAHGRPNARYQKWVMNGMGMRGPDEPALNSLATVRIVTAGASETFGLYESPDHEYPRQLEDSLAATLKSECGNGELRTEVLNAAMPGMSLPTVEQDIRLRLARLHPDIITLYPTPVQYLDDRPPMAVAPRTTAGPSLSWTRGLYPRAAQRLWDQTKMLMPAFISTRLRALDIAQQERRHGAGWKFETIPRDRLMQFESDLRRTLGSIRAAGAQPVLMTHANRFMTTTHRDPAVLTAWERMYPRATGATIVAFDSLARDVTLRVARDSLVPVADLAGDVRRNGERVFQDYAHFTDFGAARVAAELAKTMRPLLGQACTSARQEQSSRSRSVETSMAAVQ